MVKIKVSAPWDTPENILERLITQFKTPEIDLNGIDFVFDDSYDVIVFFNYINLEIPKGKQVFILAHEPTWSGNHQTNFTSTPEVKVLGFDPKFYTPSEIVTKSFTYPFYGGRGPWVDKLEDWNYSKVLDHSPKKSKIISSTITNLNHNEYIPEENAYQPRYKLVEYLIKNNKNIDYFGGWGLQEAIEKKDMVSDYMFNLAIENQFTDNWITEKFYDPILYNSIPIYYGCTNIQEYYPEKGYILIEDPFDHERTLKQLKNIQDNAEDIYNEYLPGLLKIKLKYFSEFNLLNRIIQLAKYGIRR